MPEIDIDQEGIFRLLQNLDVKKPCGPDLITNAFLQKYAVWMSKYLYVIYRRSLDTSLIPDDWRMAKVIPVHKSGSKLDVNNYRPVSLTCGSSKLFEHIIYKAIILHLENNNLLYGRQHGFRSGLSTITQLAEITHDIATAINNRSQIDAIFLDFSKAFDVVPHPALITKLSAIGIHGKTVSWIKNYLENRRQCVVVNDIMSDYLNVFSGVPQGSVLAPLLFLIYINDIQSCVQPHIQMRLFADDCVVYTTVNTREDQVKLNDSLAAIQNWCDIWGMKLNATKTTCISFTHKKNALQFTYTINNIPLRKCDEVTYLGVTLTTKLNWEPHINNIYNKALGKLHFLRRKLRNTPPSVKLNA